MVGSVATPRVSNHEAMMGDHDLTQREHSGVPAFPCCREEYSAQSPLNLPQVRGLKRASLQPGIVRSARLQPGRFGPMPRRFSAPYQSEPVSSLASWARNLAVFSVVAVLVSIIIVRFDFLEMKPALATFFGALCCAGLSILVGLAAL